MLPKPPPGERPQGLPQHRQRGLATWLQKAWRLEAQQAATFTHAICNCWLLGTSGRFRSRRSAPRHSIKCRRHVTRQLRQLPLGVAECEMQPSHALPPRAFNPSSQGHVQEAPEPTCRRAPGWQFIDVTCVLHFSGQQRPSSNPSRHLCSN